MTKAMKDNKLIAEFMELTPCDNRGEYDPQIHTNVTADLKYHKEWNWLMPVLEKINNLHWKGRQSPKTISLLDTIDLNLTDINITNTHGAVASFINWYNQKSKQ
jgi:hypothetical protein